jgi:hypothetical protein
VVDRRLLRLEIDVQLDIEPITGRLRAEHGPEFEFTGVLELLGLIDRIRDSREHPPAGEGEGS